MQSNCSFLNWNEWSCGQQWIDSPGFALHHAVRWNDAAAVAAILATDDGELIDTMDSNGMTALMTAAVWNSSLEIVKLLCKYGADTFYCSKGKTTLYIAVKYASQEVQDCIAEAEQHGLVDLDAWKVSVGLLSRLLKSEPAKMQP